MTKAGEHRWNQLFKALDEPRKRPMPTRTHMDIVPDGGGKEECPNCRSALDYRPDTNFDDCVICNGTNEIDREQRPDAPNPAYHSPPDHPEWPVPTRAKDRVEWIERSGLASLFYKSDDQWWKAVRCRLAVDGVTGRKCPPRCKGAAEPGYRYLVGTREGKRRICTCDNDIIPAAEITWQTPEEDRQYRPGQRCVCIDPRPYDLWDVVRTPYKDCPWCDGTGIIQPHGWEEGAQPARQEVGR